MSSLSSSLPYSRDLLSRRNLLSINRGLLEVLTVAQQPGELPKLAAWQANPTPPVECLRCCCHTRRHFGSGAFDIFTEIPKCFGDLANLLRIASAENVFWSEPVPIVSRLSAACNCPALLQLFMRPGSAVKLPSS